jgi:hypothetical protein
MLTNSDANENSGDHQGHCDESTEAAQGWPEPQVDEQAPQQERH